MNDDSLTRRIVVGLKAKLIADALTMASKALLLLVLTRYLLSPEEFGLLFYAISIIAIARLFADLGLAKSTARYVSEFMETDRTQVRHVVRVGLVYNLLTITLVGLAIVVFRGQIAGLVDEPALVPFLLLGPGYVGFRSLVFFQTTIFQGFNEVQWSALVATVSGVGQFVLVVGFLVLDYGTVGAFLGYTVAFAVASVVGFAVLYRRFYRELPAADGVESDLRGRILRYNFPLTWTRGAGVLTGKVDTVLVGYFLTPAAVGFYTLGKQIADFAIQPASSLGFVVSPTFGSQKANGDLGRAARIYERSFENILVLYVPAAMGIVLVARPATEFVFGADYLGAVPVIQVLSVFVVVKSIDKITNDGLDYLGRARTRAVVKSIGSVSNFLLNVLLIPTMGVVGAAVATAISITGVVGTNVVLINQELSLDLRRLAHTAARVGVVTAVMGAVVWLGLPFVSGLPSLAAVVAVGVLVWSVLAVAGGLLDIEEVRMLLPDTS